MYAPSSRPLSEIDVFVAAAEMATEFQRFPAALVMLASLFTVTEVLTKYKVPVFELLTVAFAVLFNEFVVAVATGAIPLSAMIAALANELFVLLSEKVAVVMNVYDVPSVRPLTTQVVVGAAIVQVLFPGVDVTV